MNKLSSIAVDLDGTLAKHSPGKFDPEVIGDPVPRMMSRVKRWLKDGEAVKIFTARAAQAKNIPPIKKWLKQHGILGCEITNEKTPDIKEFWDDRAVAVELNTGKVKSAATDSCPICDSPSVGRCRCSGPHTLEDLKKGHGMSCKNGHRFTRDGLFYDPSEKSASAKGIPSRKDYGDLQQLEPGNVLDYIIQQHDAEIAGCFTEDTQVRMADGTQKSIGKLQPGELVATPTGPQKVLRVWNNGRSKNWFRLTADGVTITVTANHLFYVLDVGWLSVAELHNRTCYVDAKASCLRIDSEDLSHLSEGFSNTFDFSCDLRGKLYGETGLEASAGGNGGSTSLEYSAKLRRVSDTLSDKESRHGHMRDVLSCKIGACDIGPEESAKAESGRTAREIQNCVADTQARQISEMGPGRQFKMAETEIYRRRFVAFGNSRSGPGQPIGDCLRVEESQDCPEKEKVAAHSNPVGWFEQLCLERWYLQWASYGVQWRGISASIVAKKVDSEARESMRVVRKNLGEQQGYSCAPRGAVCVYAPTRSDVAVMHDVPRKSRPTFPRPGWKILRVEALSGVEFCRYDIEVEHSHCYFVGPLLVHNSHKDLRMGSPELGLFSWASRKGVPHEPGEKTLAVRQPLHRYGYRNFEGEIPRGQYGGGTVSKVREGKLLITRTSPNAIHFTEASSPIPRRFILIKPKGQDQNWLLARDQIPSHPGVEKESYKVLQPDEAVAMMDTLMEKGVAQPKVDGALAFLRLAKGRAEVVSHRLSKRTGGAIPHTERMFKHIPGLLYPKKFEGRTFKGEIFGERGGKAIPPQELGGILNAGIARSLEKQKEQDVALKMLLFGQGGDQPYDASRAELEKLLGYLPPDKFVLPEDARTVEEASRMLEQIQSGKHPLTREGMVVHPTEGGTPTKVKFRPERDVYVRDVYPGTGKYEGVGAGGFRYSASPRGRILGNVGSGLSDELRRELLQNPELYFGRRARVAAQEAFPSGALRAPSLIALHEG